LAEVLKGKQAQGGAAAQRTAISADTQREGLRSAVERLLSQRIAEYHPDTSFTSRCIGMLRFSDRPLTDHEKLKVLAICRCYDSGLRKRTLLDYIGFLESNRSEDVDFSKMLVEFRERPDKVLDVKKYGMWKREEMKRDIEK